MLEPEVLFDKLKHMESPAEIADFCRSQLITGVPQEEHNCALAMLFLKQTGKGVSVSDAVYVSDHEYYTCTEVMRDFISLFDNHFHRDLLWCTGDDDCLCSSCDDFS